MDLTSVVPNYVYTTWCFTLSDAEVEQNLISLQVSWAAAIAGMLNTL